MLIGIITFSGGWHIPEEILSGTFRGTYNFSNNVTFQNNLNYDLEKFGDFTSCKDILEKSFEFSKFKLNSGIYKINPDGNNEFEVYCDMETDGGGWTFFGIQANNPSIAPEDFFSGSYTYQTFIDDYNNKKTFSLNLNDFDLDEFELSIIVQTENEKQELKAKSNYNSDLTYGIMKIPNKEFLLKETQYLIDNFQGNFNIKHKCLPNENYYRTLNYIENETSIYQYLNAKQQFTEALSGSGGYDIWHWNYYDDIYFRPHYSYCETTDIYGPGEKIQAIFWIR